VIITVVLPAGLGFIWKRKIKLTVGKINETLSMIEKSIRDKPIDKEENKNG